MGRQLLAEMQGLGCSSWRHLRPSPPTLAVVYTVKNLSGNRKAGMSPKNHLWTELAFRGNSGVKTPGREPPGQMIDFQHKNAVWQ